MNKAQGTKTVINVYSTPNCAQCLMTYRVLDAKGIIYEIHDVTTDQAAYAYITEDLGYSQAPVVVVDDQDHWSGFRPDHIERVASAGVK